MKKAEMKKVMQAALKSEYGFAPALDCIKLMESNDDGTYIAATVCGKYYAFNGWKWSDGAVWVGKGTVEKLPEYDLY